MKDKPFSQESNQPKDKAKEKHTTKDIQNSEEMEKARKELESWTEEQWEEAQEEWEALLEDYTSALNDNLDPESSEVQEIVADHVEYLKLFGIVAKKEDLFDRAKAYLDHPDWKKVFKSYHPKLLEFMLSSIEIYADNL